jgi:hypothetical protein
MLEQVFSMANEEEEPFLDQVDRNDEPSVGKNIDALPSQQEQIDLDTARTILQAIITTHENTINETTPLDRVAGYPTELVRQAEQVVAQSLMDEHTAYRDHSAPAQSRNYLRKDTPQGSLDLSLSGAVVGLQFYEKPNMFLVLDNEYPLEEIDAFTASHYGFTDRRPGGNRITLFDMRHGHDLNNPPLEGIRHMWRGLRWMNANMLGWKNQNTILPEQLDTLPLPSSQGKKKTT